MCLRPYFFSVRGSTLNVRLYCIVQLTCSKFLIMVDSQNCVTCEMVSLLKYWQELSGLLPNDPIKMVAKFRKNLLRIEWVYPKSLLLFLSRRHYRTEHDTLTQCWVNVGAMSETAGHHSPSIGSMHVGLTLAHWLQRWFNIRPTLRQRLVLCWFIVGPPSTTLAQH